MSNPNYDLKRGDVIEYTDEYQQDYTIGDPALARYGIVESVCGRYINVRTGKNSFEQITDDLICAQQWFGGFPEHCTELNELLETEYATEWFHPDDISMRAEDDWFSSLDLGDDGSI